MSGKMAEKTSARLRAAWDTARQGGTPSSTAGLGLRADGVGQASKQSWHLQTDLELIAALGERVLLGLPDTALVRVRALGLESAGLPMTPMGLVFAGDGEPPEVAEDLRRSLVECRIPHGAPRNRFRQVSQQLSTGECDLNSDAGDGQGFSDHLKAQIGRLTPRDWRAPLAALRSALTVVDSVDTACTAFGRSARGPHRTGRGVSGPGHQAPPAPLIALAPDPDVRWHDMREAVVDALMTIGQAFPDPDPDDTFHRRVFARPALLIQASSVLPQLLAATAPAIREEHVDVLIEICEIARRENVSVILDEEADALQPALFAVVEALLADPRLSGWNGFGLTLQASHRRTLQRISQLHALAQSDSRIVPIRLVRGSTWSEDVSKALSDGALRPPVYWSDLAMSLSWLAAAQAIVEEPDVFHLIAEPSTPVELAALELGARGRRSGMHVDLATPSVRAARALGDAKDVFRLRSTIWVGSRDDIDTLWADRAIEPILRARLGDGALLDRNVVSGSGTSVLEALTEISGEAARAAESGFDAADVGGPARWSRPILDAPGRDAQTADAHTQPAPETLLALATVPAEETPPAKRPRDEAPPPPKHEVVSPVDGHTVVCALPRMEHVDIEPRLEQLRECVSLWGDQALGARLAILSQATETLSRERDRVVAGLALGHGQPLRTAAREWQDAIDIARSILARAQTVSDAMAVANEIADPAGVVAFQISRQAPFLDTLRQSMLALTGGNAVILPVTPETATAATMVVDALVEAGLPKDVLDLVLVDEDHQIEILKCAAVRAVLVSETASAERSAMASAFRVRHSRSPLAGFDLAAPETVIVVDQTVDPVRAVATITQLWLADAGQSPTAPRAVLVAEPICEAVMDGLVNAVCETVIGDPLLAETQLGPMRSVSARDAAVAEKFRLSQCFETLIDPLPPSGVHGPFVTPAIYAAADLTGLRDLTKSQCTTGSGARIRAPVLMLAPFAADDVPELGAAVGQLSVLCDLVVFSNDRSFAATLQRTVRPERLQLHSGLDAIGRLQATTSRPEPRHLTVSIDRTAHIDPLTPPLVRRRVISGGLT